MNKTLDDYILIVKINYNKKLPAGIKYFKICIIYL